MFGRIMLLLCAAIWCACGAFALAALAGRARRAMRRCGFSVRVVFLLAAAACVMLAGGKGGSVSVRDDYIQDAGSYLTNDVAHVAIAKRTPNLPDSTEILVYARELSSTNAADWFRLSPHLTFADHPYDYALPNATNYSVLVSSSFVPEPTVHTNGVWALRGFEIPGHAGRYAFGNSRTRTILTAADYVQDGLVLMLDYYENIAMGVSDHTVPYVYNIVPNGANYVLDNITFDDVMRGFSRAQGTSVLSNDSRLTSPFATCNATVELVADYHVGMDSLANGWGCAANPTQDGYAFVFVAAKNNQLRVSKTGAQVWDTLTPTDRSHSAIVISGNTMTSYCRGVYDKTVTFTSTGPQYCNQFAFGGIPRYSAARVDCTRCVRVYSRTLSADEIRRNCEIDRIRFNLP